MEYHYEGSVIHGDEDREKRSEAPLGFKISSQVEPEPDAQEYKSQIANLIIEKQLHLEEIQKLKQRESEEGDRDLETKIIKLEENLSIRNAENVKLQNIIDESSREPREMSMEYHYEGSVIHGDEDREKRSEAPLGFKISSQVEPEPDAQEYKSQIANLIIEKQLHLEEIQKLKQRESEGDRDLETKIIKLEENLSIRNAENVKLQNIIDESSREPREMSMEYHYEGSVIHGDEDREKRSEAPLGFKISSQVEPEPDAQEYKSQIANLIIEKQLHLEEIQKLKQRESEEGDRDLETKIIKLEENLSIRNAENVKLQNIIDESSREPREMSMEYHYEGSVIHGDEDREKRSEAPLGFKISSQVEPEPDAQEYKSQIANLIIEKQLHLEEIQKLKQRESEEGDRDLETKIIKLEENLSIRNAENVKLQNIIDESSREPREMSMEYHYEGSVIHGDEDREKRSEAPLGFKISSQVEPEPDAQEYKSQIANLIIEKQLHLEEIQKLKQRESEGDRDLETKIIKLEENLSIRNAENVKLQNIIDESSREPREMSMEYHYEGSVIHGDEDREKRSEAPLGFKISSQVEPEPDAQEYKSQIANLIIEKQLHLEEIQKLKQRESEGDRDLETKIIKLEENLSIRNAENVKLQNIIDESSREPREMSMEYHYEGSVIHGDEDREKRSEAPLGFKISSQVEPEPDAQEYKSQIANLIIEKQLHLEEIQKLKQRESEGDRDLETKIIKLEENLSIRNAENVKLQNIIDESSREPREMSMEYHYEGSVIHGDEDREKRSEAPLGFKISSQVEPEPDAQEYKSQIANLIIEKQLHLEEIQKLKQRESEGDRDLETKIIKLEENLSIRNAENVKLQNIIDEGSREPREMSMEYHYEGSVIHGDEDREKRSEAPLGFKISSQVEPEPDAQEYKSQIANLIIEKQLHLEEIQKLKQRESEGDRDLETKIIKLEENLSIRNAENVKLQNIIDEGSREPREMSMEYHYEGSVIHGDEDREKRSEAPLGFKISSQVEPEPDAQEYKSQIANLIIEKQLHLEEIQKLKQRESEEGDRDLETKIIKLEENLSIRNAENVKLQNIIDESSREPREMSMEYHYEGSVIHGDEDREKRSEAPLGFKISSQVEPEPDAQEYKSQIANLIIEKQLHLEEIQKLKQRESEGDRDLETKIIKLEENLSIRNAENVKLQNIIDESSREPREMSMEYHYEGSVIHGDEDREKRSEAPLGFKISSQVEPEPDAQEYKSQIANLIIEKQLHLEEIQKLKQRESEGDRDLETKIIKLEENLSIRNAENVKLQNIIDESSREPREMSMEYHYEGSVIHGDEDREKRSEAPLGFKISSQVEPEPDAQEYKSQIANLIIEKQLHLEEIQKLKQRESEGDRDLETKIIKLEENLSIRNAENVKLQNIIDESSREPREMSMEYHYEGSVIHGDEDREKRSEAPLGFKISFIEEHDAQEYKSQIANLIAEKQFLVDEIQDLKLKLENKSFEDQNISNILPSNNSSIIKQHFENSTKQTELDFTSLTKQHTQLKESYQEKMKIFESTISETNSKLISKDQIIQLQTHNFQQIEEKNKELNKLLTLKSNSLAKSKSNEKDMKRHLQNLIDANKEDKGLGQQVWILNEEIKRITEKSNQNITILNKNIEELNDIIREKESKFDQISSQFERIKFSYLQLQEEFNEKEKIIEEMTNKLDSSVTLGVDSISPLKVIKTEGNVLNTEITNEEDDILYTAPTELVQMHSGELTFSKATSPLKIPKFARSQTMRFNIEGIKKPTNTNTKDRKTRTPTHNKVQLTAAENTKLKVEIRKSNFRNTQTQSKLDILKEEKWKLEVFADNREKVIEDLQVQADSATENYLLNSKNLKQELGNLRKEVKERGIKLFEIEYENYLMKKNISPDQKEFIEAMRKKASEYHKSTVLLQEQDTTIRTLREECHKLTIDYSTSYTEKEMYAKKCSVLEKELSCIQIELNSLQEQVDLIIDPGRKPEKAQSEGDLLTKHGLDGDYSLEKTDLMAEQIKNPLLTIQRLSEHSKTLQIAHENLRLKFTTLLQENNDLKQKYSATSEQLLQREIDIEKRDMLIVEIKKSSDALDFDYTTLEGEFMTLKENYGQLNLKLKNERALRVNFENENNIYKQSETLSKNESVQMMLNQEKTIQNLESEIEKFEKAIVMMERVINDKEDLLQETLEKLRISMMAKRYIKKSLSDLLTNTGLGEEFSYDDQERFDYDYIVTQLKFYMEAHSKIEAEIDSPTFIDKDQRIVNGTKKLFQLFIEKCPPE